MRARARRRLRAHPQILRLQRAALGADDRVLLVDAWVETGSQAAGGRALVEECGATFLGVAAIVDQLPPDRRELLVQVHTLLPKGLLGDDGASSRSRPGGMPVPRHPPTLHLTCGLPGSGKTTLARRLTVERDAQRLTKDEWMLALGGDLFDEQLSVRMEAQLIELSFDLLAAGRSCILDFGLWSREERDALRLRARAQGVRVELHVLDVDLDELVRRAAKRSADAPHTTVAMRADQLATWAAAFETPSDAERCLFDSA